MFKLIYTSPASRNIYRYRARRNVYWKAGALSLHKKGNVGRTLSGRRVMRSKASLLHKNRSIQINYTYSRFKASFISNFLFLPYRNKLLSLIRYSHGALAYHVTIENHKIFSFFYAPSLRVRPRFRSMFSARLMFFANLSKICLIELTTRRGAQYCRSSGTIAKILKIDRKNDTSLIRLPSGRAKLFSMYAFASVGRVLFKENRNFLNSKAGYWRGFGFKPTVRGVAMNPVDHPHGGRTNSIKYPRTPWGKTTKYK